MDAQSVKTTETAQQSGYDAGKNVRGIKRHMAVDSEGLPHAIEVIGRLNAWILVIFVVLLAVFFVRGWRKGRRRAKESGGNDPDRVDPGAS